MTATIGALMAFLLLSGGVGALPARATAPALPDYTVALTAYNAVPAQTDGDPFITASGIYANPEIVAARSRDLANVLPFGTIIEIVGAPEEGGSCGFNVVAPSIGYRVIADTMHQRYTDRIDILFSTSDTYRTAGGTTKNAATVLGVCKGAEIRVVGYVNLNYSNRVPRTQEELAALVDGRASALAVK